MNIGHNTTAGKQVHSFVERVERLAEEKAEIAAQMTEVYAEAKANGYDIKTLRKIVALRKKTDDERAEEEALLDLYLHAMGMVDEPPLVAVIQGGPLSDRVRVALSGLAPAKGSNTITGPDGRQISISRDDKGRPTIKLLDEPVIRAKGAQAGVAKTTSAPAKKQAKPKAKTP